MPQKNLHSGILICLALCRLLTSSSLASAQVLSDPGLQLDISSNNIDNNRGDGIFVGQNAVVNLGEDTGISIFELPNTTNGNNGGFGVACADGGIADGRLGTLSGNLGPTSFPGGSGCNDLPQHDWRLSSLLIPAKIVERFSRL